MTEASSRTQRVAYLNANWTPSPEGDGRSEPLVITENEDRHSTRTTAADLTALASVIRDGVVLLWDPEGQVLILSNLVGEWIPLDWSNKYATRHSGNRLNRLVARRRAASGWFGPRPRQRPRGARR